MGFHDDHRECAICTKLIEPGQHIVTLGCNIFHVFHAECWKSLEDFYAESDLQVNCPICCSKFDEDKMIKSVVMPKAGEVVVERAASSDVKPTPVTNNQAAKKE